MYYRFTLALVLLLGSSVATATEVYTDLESSGSGLSLDPVFVTDTGSNSSATADLAAGSFQTVKTSTPGDTAFAESGIRPSPDSLVFTNTGATDQTYSFTAAITGTYSLTGTHTGSTALSTFRIQAKVGGTTMTAGGQHRVSIDFDSEGGIQTSQNNLTDQSNSDGSMTASVSSLEQLNADLALTEIVLAPGSTLTFVGWVRVNGGSTAGAAVANHSLSLAVNISSADYTTSTAAYLKWITAPVALSSPLLKLLPLILNKEAPEPSTALVGSWFHAADQTLITFIDEARYFVTQDIDDAGEPQCSDGMESGAYTWDPENGSFGYTNVIDTTGDCGLTSVQGETGSATVTVSGSTLTFTDSEGSFPLEEVIDASNPIVGGWFLVEPEGGETLVTFLDETNYFMAQDNIESDEPSCSDGMESGTYTWESATGDFGYTNLVDTTGDCGLTSFQGESGSGTVTVSGDTLTFADDEGSVSLPRVQ